MVRIPLPASSGPRFPSTLPFESLDLVLITTTDASQSNSNQAFFSEFFEKMKLSFLIFPFHEKQLRSRLLSILMQKGCKMKINSYDHLIVFSKLLTEVLSLLYKFAYQQTSERKIKNNAKPCIQNKAAVNLKKRTDKKQGFDTWEKPFVFCYASCVKSKTVDF